MLFFGMIVSAAQQCHLALQLVNTKPQNFVMVINLVI
jgi:hypothetical protein